MLADACQRETEDVATRKLIAQSKADQEKWLAAISLTLSHLGTGAQALITDHLMDVAIAVVAIALGAFLSREMVSLVRMELQRRLAQPRLVRETSRRGFWMSLGGTLYSSLTCARSGPVDGFKDVILPAELDKSLRILAVSSRCECFAQQRCGIFCPSWLSLGAASLFASGMPSGTVLRFAMPCSTGPLELERPWLLSDLLSTVAWTLPS